MLTWRNQGTSIAINFEEKKLLFNGELYPMQVVTNQALFNMRERHTIYLTSNCCTEEKTLYYCVRKLLKGVRDRQEFLYIDVLAYEFALGIVGENILNRSLGHVNDQNEIEIHQVLCGKLLELVIFEGNIYVGVFCAHDYFEIPAGAFHCTYVLENNTVVANIFGNVYWEDDYARKPYGEFRNPFCIERVGDRVCVKTENSEVCILNGGTLETNEIGILDYAKIPKEAMKISAQYSLNANIFTLFRKMICM